MMSFSRARSASSSLLGDAESFAVRDVDQEPAGKRDLGRQPGALRLHRILDRLHEQLLAAGDQILDLLAVMPLALELGDDDLVDVQEPVLLEPDLDERGFHAREDVVDDAEIDVACDRAALGPLEVHLGDPIVLDHRDTLLTDVDRDQELALRGGQRRPPRRLTPALGAPALTRRRRSAARSARWLCSGFSRALDPSVSRQPASRRLLRPHRRRWSLAATAAATAAPPFVSLRFGLGPCRGRSCCRVCG